MKRKYILVLIVLVIIASAVIYWLYRKSKNSAKTTETLENGETKEVVKEVTITKEDLEIAKTQKIRGGVN